MWGGLELDTYNNLLYWVGFINYENLNLLQLVQWQYWWWFWFAFLWSLYFFLFVKVFSNASIRFFPKIFSSFRSHGKWGDFFVGLVPVVWCINILVNSSTIFKLLEWQNNTCVFTVRIRAKQWYWVYKISTNNLNILDDRVVFLGRRTYNFKLNNTHTNIDTNIKPTTQTNTNIVYDSVVFFLFKDMCKKNTINKVSDFFYNNVFNKYTNNNTLSVVNNNKQFYTLHFSKNIKFLGTNLFKHIFETNINKTNIQRSEDYVTIIQHRLVKTQENIPNKKQNLLNTNNTNIIFDSKLTTKTTLINTLRLLRVQKVLYLPTRVNIGIISSSYDVVHSWFIPGLGLKLDCVPGRSTHHIIYINQPGFYFGQCAEICGRYHHHMPIRICALEYIHFLLWWYTWVQVTKK